MTGSSILDLWGHSFAIYHADSITPSEVVTGPSTQIAPSLRVPVIAVASPHLAYSATEPLLLGCSYSSGPKAYPTCAADLAIFLKPLPAQHRATSIRSSVSVFLALVLNLHVLARSPIERQHASLALITSPCCPDPSLSAHKSLDDIRVLSLACDPPRAAPQTIIQRRYTTSFYPHHGGPICPGFFFIPIPCIASWWLQLFVRA